VPDLTREVGAFTSPCGPTSSLERERVNSERGEYTLRVDS